MKPLRLGFIGGGINSAVGRAHYAACRMDGRFEVVAGVFSRDESVNTKTAEEFNCYAYPSLSKMALIIEDEGEDLGAIVILTPTPSHFGIIRQAMLNNIPVICEKSLAATSAESGILCGMRENESGFLAVTYNYTGYPMVRELRDMALRGELGKVISVQAEMPQEGYLRTDASPQAWRREDGSIPAVHLDLGTHLHHLIHFVTGDHPAQLVAHQQSAGLFGVVDDVRCIAEYNSGFVADIRFGKTSLGNRNGLRIRVEGTCGAAEWVQGNPGELAVCYADGKRTTVDRASPDCRIANLPRYQRFKAGHPAGFIEAYANLYYDLAEWLEDYKKGAGEKTRIMADGVIPLMYGSEIAHEGLVMMEAMVKSAKEKTWVTV
jgi:predicted dehydrogenase